MTSQVESEAVAITRGLAAIVNPEVAMVDPTLPPQCFFCRERTWNTHDEDCLWRRARAVVRRQTPPPMPWLRDPPDRISSAQVDALLSVLREMRDLLASIERRT